MIPYVNVYSIGKDDHPGLSRRIVDCHWHTGNWRYHWSAEDIVPVMEKEGIDFALVSALESPPGPQSKSNAEVLKEVEKYPDRLGALAWANPLDTGWLDDLTKTLDTGLCYGIKIHPSRYKYDMDKFPEILDPVFQVADDYNLPILTHTDEEFSPPKNFEPLIAKYPDVPLVLYHSYPMVQSIALAVKYPNVYLENSWVADNPDFVLVAVKAVGSERVLFGSDAPVSFGWNPTQPYPADRTFFARRINYILNLPLTDREKENILYRNTEKLFRIKRP